MKTFEELFEENFQKTETQKGAVAYSHMGSNICDFYSIVGASRNMGHREIETMFEDALIEDAEKAIIILFYARDPRGGLGERRVFRICMEYLQRVRFDLFNRVLHLVDEYGRWDDRIHLAYISRSAHGIKTIQRQLEKDYKKALNGENGVSLLGKWMPSENASAKDTKEKARFFQNQFSLSPKKYRIMLSTIREHLDVVERKISANNWRDIEYSKVPSRAGMIYSDAFMRNDQRRYEKFLEDVEKGKEKVNASVLYPYEIMAKAKDDYKKYLEEAWNALPDYFPGNSVLPVIDVSGSMTENFGNSNSITCMDVAISLGLYVSERLEGFFKNKFVTFSEKPRLNAIRGNNLNEKYHQIRKSDWGVTTNVSSVMNLILHSAIEAGATQEELPEKILIVSDMEFDAAMDNRYQSTWFKKMKEKFDDAGYKIPEIIFWRVNVKTIQFPVRKDEEGTVIVSGASPIVLENIGNLDEFTVENYIAKILNDERYQPVLNAINDGKK